MSLITLGGNGRSGRRGGRALAARRRVHASRFHGLVVRAALSLLVALLIAFHGLLLWQRIVDLTLFQPIPALRWLATLAVLVGIWRLWRRGDSLVRGRRAGVLWLLVLLLHVSLLAPSGGSEALLDARPDASGLLLVLPVATVAVALWRLVLRGRLRRVRFGAPSPGSTLARSPFPPHFACLAGFLPSLACRPPPLS